LIVTLYEIIAKLVISLQRSRRGHKALSSIIAES